MVSGGNGIIRTFPPLPRTRSCASLSSRSSSSSARTSHDRNPLSNNKPTTAMSRAVRKLDQNLATRSEEHTSELQSLRHLVCRLLLERYGDHRDLHSFPTRRSSDLTIATRSATTNPPRQCRAPCENWTRTWRPDRKSTRLNSSHLGISYAVFCLKDTATTEIYTLSLHDALPISRSQPAQQQQTHHGNVARRAKTGPEPGDLFHRQRLDDAGRHLQPQICGPRTPASAMTPAGWCPPDALQPVRAMRHLHLEVKPEQAPQHRRAAIDGFRRELGQLLPLGPHILDERRFGECLRVQAHHIHIRLLGPPADKVQEQMSVIAQGKLVQPAHPLHIQKAVDPGNLAPVLFHHAVGRRAGAHIPTALQ